MAEPAADDGASLRQAIMATARRAAAGEAEPAPAEEEACPMCDSSSAWTMIVCGEVSVVPVCPHDSQPQAQQGGVWPVLFAFLGMTAIVLLFFSAH